MLRNTNRYINIDKSAYNKNIILSAYVKSAGNDIALYFYDTSNSIIEKHIYYTSGANLSSWKEDEKTLIDSSVIVPCKIKIPEGTNKIGIQKWDTSGDTNLYNISIEN